MWQRPRVLALLGWLAVMVGLIVQWVGEGDVNLAGRAIAVAGFLLFTTDLLLAWRRDRRRASAEGAPS